MDFLKVNTENRVYDIAIAEDFCYLAESLLKLGFEEKKFFIISDHNVMEYFGDAVKNELYKITNNVLDFTFNAGEKQKNLSTIELMYKGMIEAGLDRKSVVIALGGGVTGDMAGFASSTFMRGIPFVQIPTTLLSQVDSSVGGKVGVDFMGYKNMIGSFYQPQLVYISLETLKTLPLREFNAGMAEVIKYGYILDKEFIGYIKENIEKIKEYHNEALSYIIKKSCEYKADVVSKDEKELGLREILNYGHTIGHAIESLFDFSYIHGECVALGMLSALTICENRGFVSKEDVKECKSILEGFSLPVSIPDLDEDKVYKQMFKDKKTRDNTLRLVLLKEIGKSFTDDKVTKEEIYNAVKFIKQG